ncbi:amidohydrolase [Flavobacteriaceae bacterium TK19130]|nr:amidohydrolase [Thermobacterium salinum]
MSILKQEYLSPNPYERLTEVTSEFVKGDYVVDIHAHLFDIECINKSYFLLRWLKDFLGLKSNAEELVDYSIDELYAKKSVYTPGWEKNLERNIKSNNLSSLNKFNSKKGIIDLIRARKFLGFKRMIDVYDYYIKEFSPANYFKLPKKQVLITALMMDLEIGWNVKTNKTYHEQVLELKQLSKEKPILPFLFCDPRRADLKNETQNLYELFNLAFEEPGFFGVKIYPALGYDPSDCRLWPIYEVCEKFNIPVLTHCGGESVSTDVLSLEIYEGEKENIVNVNKRTELAYELNDPGRWALVLEKFPKLKLNFGHFGGYKTWSSSTPVSKEKDPQSRKETIFGFMKKYENVYADFSYNLIEIELTDNLKNYMYFDEIIRLRTMFGTDYWVVNKAGDLMKEQANFLNIMDSGTKKLGLSKKLCIENPKDYLFKV